MKTRLSLLLLLFYNIHRTSSYYSTTLRAPPPRAQLPVQNILHRKHETSQRNSKSFQNSAKPRNVKKKEGGGVFSSLVKSVMSLFPFGNKRLSVKLVRNKSQNLIKSKQFVKKKPRKLIPAKKPPPKKPRILTNQTPVRKSPATSHHVNDNNKPSRRQIKNNNNNNNNNNKPSRRQIKKLVVELNKTVADILQQQTGNTTSSDLRDADDAVVTSDTNMPTQVAEQAPPPSQGSHHESSSKHLKQGEAGNTFRSTNKVKRLVDTKRYQTSFSSNSIEKIAVLDGGMKDDEFEFKPFVPDFLLLESGSESEESESSPVKSRENTRFKDDWRDANRPSLRALDQGVQIEPQTFGHIDTGDHTDDHINKGDHTGDRGCSDPVAGCYERMLDAKIVQLQREMNRLEEKYWGNRV